MIKIVRFTGMCCANCAANLERKLNKIKGVKATISFVSKKISIEYDDVELLNKAIELCKKEEPEAKFIL